MDLCARVPQFLSLSDEYFFFCQIRILTKNVLPDLTRKAINLRKGSKTLAFFKPQRSQVTDGSREKQKSVYKWPGPILNFSLKKLEEKRKHENLRSLFQSFSGVTRSDPKVFKEA